MIIATAGHVDHGKTLLVKALTGTDTDRLPEEKARGLTIDLGFAYRRLESGETIGFVDVPGHERFIHNLLAGVTGVEGALLTVAADDGVMPQTIEHVAILDLIGVSRTTVAVTKTDRVETSRVEEVVRNVQDLLEGTVLQGAPIYPVSAVTGDGLDRLSLHLEQSCISHDPPKPSGYFRLPVDRSFVIPGTGLVVTGSVFAGKVEEGHRPHHLPSGIAVRVRSLHADNEKAGFATQGQRCALNIVGPDLKRIGIHRGDWLVGDPNVEPVRRFDVWIRVPRHGQSVKHWSTAHVYLGAARGVCRIALLGGAVLSAGESGYARLYVDRAMGAFRQDRLILRDTSARCTLAGGHVVDPLPPERGRSNPERLEILEALDEADVQTSLTRLLEASKRGVNLDGFSVRCNLTPDERIELWQRVSMNEAGSGSEKWGVHPVHWKALCEDIRKAVDDWHVRHPARLGPTSFQVIRSLPRRPAPIVVDAGLSSLVAGGEFGRSGAIYHRAGRRVEIADEDRQYWSQIERLLLTTPLRPPRVAELAEKLSMRSKDVEPLLNRLAGLGLVVRVTANRYYLPKAVLKLARMGEQLAEKDDLSAAAFNAATETGRNLSIEILEFFDRSRFTRRHGNQRRILQPALEIFG